MFNQDKGLIVESWGGHSECPPFNFIVYVFNDKNNNYNYLITKTCQPFLSPTEKVFFKYSHTSSS